MVTRKSGRVVWGLLIAAALAGSGPVLSSASASGPMVTEFTTGLTAGAVPNGITKGPDGAMWFTEFRAGKIGRVSEWGGERVSSAGPDAAQRRREPVGD